MWTFFKIITFFQPNIRRHISNTFTPCILNKLPLLVSYFWSLSIFTVNIGTEENLSD